MSQEPHSSPVAASLDFDALAVSAETSPPTLAEVLPLALDESEAFAIVDEEAAFGADHFIPDAVIDGAVPPEDDLPA